MCSTEHTDTERRLLKAIFNRELLTCSGGQLSHGVHVWVSVRAFNSRPNKDNEDNHLKHPNSWSENCDGYLPFSWKTIVLPMGTTSGDTLSCLLYLEEAITILISMVPLRIALCPFNIYMFKSKPSCYLKCDLTWK